MEISQPPLQCATGTGLASGRAAINLGLRQKCNHGFDDLL
jgi:hypothetical protein